MKAKRESYVTLRNDLLSARFKTPFEVYLSTAYVSSIIVGLSAACMIGIITWVFQLPKLITYTEGRFLSFWLDFPRTAL